jgi:MSHA biogenesis protein MshN
MSLVNDMLKDLEKRQSPKQGDAGELLQGLNYAERPRGRPRYVVVLIGIVAVIAGAAVVSGWQFLPKAQQLVAQRTSDVTQSAPSPGNQMPAAPTQPDAAKPTVIEEESTPTDQPMQTRPEPAPEPSVEKITVAETVAPLATQKKASTPPATTKPEVKVALAPVPATPTPKPEPTPAAEATPVVTKPAPAPQSAPQMVIRRSSAEVLSPQEHAARSYLRARKLIEGGKIYQGEAALEQALGADPSHLAARETLATLQLSSNRLAQAGNTLDVGLAMAPEHTPFRMLKARVLLQQKQLASAVSVLEAGQPNSSSGDYNVLLAALYQQAKRFDDAAKLYRQLVEARPQSGTLWLGLAMAKEGQTELPTARLAYHRAVEAGGLSDNSRQYALNRIRALAAAGVN